MAKEQNKLYMLIHGEASNSRQTLTASMNNNNLKLRPTIATFLRRGGGGGSKNELPDPCLKDQRRNVQHENNFNILQIYSASPPDLSFTDTNLIKPRLQWSITPMYLYGYMYLR